MKRILVTAGTVYGPLDANKLVGNRIRGVWATKFAYYLHKRGHNVTLLIADVQRREIEQLVMDRASFIPTVQTHRGFWDYQEQCEGFAKTHDAAVMAAAVVNWIPKAPFPGKMPTENYKPGDEIHVPFILAPRVIDAMRTANPNLTLIGCKMTVGASHNAMIEAAYKTLLGARCHAVVANDMAVGLKVKTVLYPDQAQFYFDMGSTRVDDSVEAFYQHLEQIILDEHWRTIGITPQVAYETPTDPNAPSYQDAEARFDAIVDRYRARFVHKVAGSDRVFGSLAVRTGTGAICSPREKGDAFSSADAVDVLRLTPDDLKQRRVCVIRPEQLQTVPKATLNAPLLLRHLETFPWAAAVLHLHEELPGYPTVVYAPPGTCRDNLREIVGPVYNIQGHGCIATLDARGEVWGSR